MLKKSKSGQAHSIFPLIGLFPTVITKAPLLLIGWDAPLDLQVSRGLQGAVVEVTARPRPLTQVSTGQWFSAFKLQEEERPQHLKQKRVHRNSVCSSFPSLFQLHKGWSELKKKKFGYRTASWPTGRERTVCASFCYCVPMALGPQSKHQKRATNDWRVTIHEAPSEALYIRDFVQSLQQT